MKLSEVRYADGGMPSRLVAEAPRTFSVAVRGRKADLPSQVIFCFPDILLGKLSVRFILRLYLRAGLSSQLEIGGWLNFLMSG